MADKSIWKKTLGWFVEIEDGENQVSDPTDLDAILGETEKALASLQGTPVTPPPAKPVASVIKPYVSGDEVRQLVEQQPDLSEDEEISFQELYDTVTETGKTSVFVLEEILSAPELQSLPKETKAKAATVTLRAMGATVEDIVQDAYQKDRALDTAELVKRQKASEQKQTNEAQIQAIKQEVDAFLKEKDGEMETLREDNLNIDRQLNRWVQAKLNEEQRIRSIVSHFVSEENNQVTLGEVHPPSMTPSAQV